MSCNGFAPLGGTHWLWQVWRLHRCLTLLSVLFNFIDLFHVVGNIVFVLFLWILGGLSFCTSGVRFQDWNISIKSCIWYFVRLGDGVVSFLCLLHGIVNTYMFIVLFLHWRAPRLNNFHQGIIISGWGTILDLLDVKSQLLSRRLGKSASLISWKMKSYHLYLPVSTSTLKFSDISKCLGHSLHWYLILRNLFRWLVT